jgi:hypothetical protein
MRTLATLGTALGIALLLHAPASAQTLGELGAAQGVGSSVGAAEASSATTARSVGGMIRNNLQSPPGASAGKSAWADAGDSHGASAASSGKGWASAKSGQGTAAKGWVSARSGTGAGTAKGWVTADSGKPAGRK